MAKRDERDNRFKVVPKGASEREREREINGGGGRGRDRERGSE